MNIFKGHLHRPACANIIMTLVVLSFLILPGCVKNPADNRPGTSGFMLETDPAISFDRNWVYLVATDTNTSTMSGIYRANIDHPTRELVLAGENFVSPSVSPNLERLACIRADSMIVYDLNSVQPTVLDSSGEFASISYVNDTLLVGTKFGPVEYGGTMWLINTVTGASTYFQDGYDASACALDTILYFQYIPGQAAAVLRQSVISDNVDTLHIEANLGLPGWTRWPSAFPGSDRIAFVHATTSLKQVKTIEPSPPNPPWEQGQVLDTTNYDKVAMAGPDIILFTGPDGRLYQSNFDGSSILPFWEAISDN